MAISAVIFSFIVHPEFGPLNQLLRLLGFRPQNWLGNPNLALPTIAMLQIWRGLGFYVIVYVAALGRVPEELYEAGRIDGTTGWQAFRYLTLPLIRPVILFTLVMATIWNLQMFDSVYVMTDGGPAYSTATVVWFIFDNAFAFDKVGYAATMSIFLLMVTLVLTLFQVRFLRSEMEY
jgi:ABC-type sugar transport system permease subunit